MIRIVSKNAITKVYFEGREVPMVVSALFEHHSPEDVPTLTLKVLAPDVEVEAEGARLQPRRP